MKTTLGPIRQSLLVAWIIATSSLWISTCVAQACSGRHVLNGTWGVITSNSQGIYASSTQCEWLIDSGSVGRYITISFSSFDTECGFDYVFVYDGDSYTSPLLASLSGGTIPDNVTASSGKMLVYFYSDKFQELSGFSLTFSVTDCPYNCSAKHFGGVCNPNTGACLCNSRYRGAWCQESVCPGSCSGCTGRTSTDGCLCNSTVTGLTGRDCSIDMRGYTSAKRWSQLAAVPGSLPPRYGHGTAVVAATDRLYVFGGKNFGGVLGDLLYIDLAAGVPLNDWVNITTTPRPSAREDHAMTSLARTLYIHGGRLTNGDISDEFWSYDTTSNAWALLSSGGPDPPALAAHTFTAAADRNALYIVGGRTRDDQLSPEVYCYNLTSNAWSRVAARGGASRGVAAHATVYHAPSRSLWVYGGLGSASARTMERRAGLVAFDLEAAVWVRVQYNQEGGPGPLAHHSMVLLGEYLVVYGGHSHASNPAVGTCFSPSLALFHLGCQRWVNYTTFLSAAEVATSPRGRYGHSAVGVWGNSVAVVGGYDGAPLADLQIHSLPAFIAKNQAEQRTGAATDDPCLEHGRSGSLAVERCREDPECFWCPSASLPQTHACMHSTRRTQCTAAVTQEANCPGPCTYLPSCLECTTLGQGASTTGAVPFTTRSPPCSWCVKEQQCQPRNGLSRTCLRADATPSGLVGWWGGKSAALTSPETCLTDDLPPGLRVALYRHPAEEHLPDKVVHIMNATVNMALELTGEQEKNLGGFYTLRTNGSVYTLSITPTVTSSAYVWLYVQTALMDLTLWIDNNVSGATKYVAKNVVGSPPNLNQQAMNPSQPTSQSTNVFPQQHSRYYVELLGKRRVGVAGTSARVGLSWTAQGVNFLGTTAEVSYEFLQPYSSGLDCPLQTSCYGCMMDIACGWCETQNTCLSRSANATCGPRDSYWVTDPQLCSACHNATDCDTCLQSSGCEWWGEERTCTRRGRLPGVALTSPAQCPVPCHNLTDCGACVNQSECAWCGTTGSCFSTAHYDLDHVYGICGSVVESNCSTCADITDGKLCLRSLGCGWCGNTQNPLLGTCVDGGFRGPLSGQSCPSLVAAAQANVSSSDPASWSYDIFPDVKECALGLDGCHVNATCINTPEAYRCECNRGFVGDGVDICNTTCFYDCQQGSCSGDPLYECDCHLGWHGLNCSQDCGCYNHSTCSVVSGGTTVCDRCQDLTGGSRCDLCVSGSFGDATLPIGCSACDCNGHGISSQGLCNTTTGECYCTDNTEGFNCQQCATGYYGDPRNGEVCYKSCRGRQVTVNATTEHIGSRGQENIPAPWTTNCAWVITPYAGLADAAAASVAVPGIMLKIDGMDIPCDADALLVYDGLPGTNTNASSPSRLIARLCGNAVGTSVLQASSGVLSLVLEAQTSAEFNATYSVLQCPCSSPRLCLGGQCVCPAGYKGFDCEIEACPNNCSLPNGACNATSQRCECVGGYWGEDCSAWLPPLYPLPWSLGARPPLHLAGHTMVMPDNDTVLVFGGHSGRGVSGELLELSLSGEAWSRLVPPSLTPPPRYLHAAAYVNSTGEMCVSGGLDDNGTVFDDVWCYHVANNSWRSLVKLPQAMAGHTLTEISDSVLLLVGGYSPSQYFNPDVLKINVSDASPQWAKLSRSGYSPVGVYGHTAVLHKPTNSVYVHGGVRFYIDEVEVSHNTSVFRLDTEKWSVLPPLLTNSFSNAEEPIARVFHVATVMGDYMFVGGGLTSGYAPSNTTALYRFSCGAWTSVGMDALEFPTVWGHASAQWGSLRVVLGGMDQSTSFDTSSPLLVKLPQDPCVFLRSYNACRDSFGCDACNATIGGASRTLCYSPGYRPAGCSTIWQGHNCSHTDVQCSGMASCSDCLAEWTAYDSQAQPLCQWCFNCGGRSKCLPTAVSCAQTCASAANTITDRAACTELKCNSPTCSDCSSYNHDCTWSRQIKRTSELVRHVYPTATSEWNCGQRSIVSQATTQNPGLNLQTHPPAACPAPCTSYLTCSACVRSTGGEGGVPYCTWLHGRQLCVPPASLPLLHTMEATPVSIGSQYGHTDASCPAPCLSFEICGLCLSRPGCGWCAFGGLEGRGVCMEGGQAPSYPSYCNASGMYLGPALTMPPAASNWSSQAVGPPGWSFLTCPPENECLTGHHTCSPNENCTDRPDGYLCTCKPGYDRNPTSGTCDPVCVPTCGNHGTCTSPNTCTCHFSYVGPQCGTACNCHGHSNCVSPQNTSVCLKCHNNTQGPQCQECLPLHVGDPTSGSPCVPCFTFCNGHTDMCADVKVYNASISQRPLHLVTPAFVSGVSSRGPSSGAAVCIGCANSTAGGRCETCLAGHFRIKTYPRTDACQACLCNGHGSTCDWETGEDCDCGNHTRTTCTGQTTCYTKQCVECSEYYQGSPTGGHQCYRTVPVDQPFCLDPQTQNLCDSGPALLEYGDVTLFMLRPKYLNLDLRLVVDVSQGEADIFLSTDADVFVLQYNASSGEKDISVDTKYSAAPLSGKRRRRQATGNVLTTFIHQYPANTLHSFLQAARSDQVLVVKGLTSRQVITLPFVSHNLKLIKFYIVLKGRSVLGTAGEIFFIQDQAAINLFVFFSVFFACFFLFLTIAILGWKGKQSYDQRRAREQREIEMNHMASRPLGVVCLVLDNKPGGRGATAPEDSPSPALPHHLPPLTEARRRGLVSASAPRTAPLALEPTDDGVAAVGTVLLQLPNVTEAGTRVVLGSALITLRQMYSGSSGVARWPSTARRRHSSDDA